MIPFTFVGPNFLGKLHNTKQHIQFIRYIKGDIIIPDNVLESFLTVFSHKYKDSCSPMHEVPVKIQNIRNAFDTCSVFVFEICSMKLFERDGFQVQSDLTDSFDTVTLQSKEELLRDLKVIIGMVPAGKRIVFQGHFRLDYIFSDPDKKIQNRDNIFDTLQLLLKSGEFPNVRVYDPSEVLRHNPHCFSDPTHFNEFGHGQSFQSLFVNCIADLDTSTSPH
jgi:hypothetical protein